MRKHLYLIVDHPEDDRVGQVKITDTRLPRSDKNNRTPASAMNVETGERWEYTVVSMGYVDYEGEEEYEEKIADDVQEKLTEIDEGHIEAAGLDPDGVLPRGEA